MISPSAGPPGRDVALIDLGRCAYDEAHRWQLVALNGVRDGAIPEVLFLVEHPPTITLGRRADPTNILTDSVALERMGIAVRQTERGGDVTYHGPGQLVAYPILRLHDHGLGASDYMHRLEDVVIDVLEGYGIRAARRERLIGVWVGTDKVCAMGVRVRGGVTMHGLALNVDPDMTHWAAIVPCGIRDGGVTSLRALLGVAPSLADVRARLSTGFERAFGVPLVPATTALLASLSPPGVDPPRP